jgi:hypothetical protein
MKASLQDDRISVVELKNDRLSPKWHRFTFLISSSSFFGNIESHLQKKKRKCCLPILYQFNPGKIETKWSSTNPKSIMPPSTHDMPLKSVSKLITNSLTVEGLLVSKSLQETNTPTKLILLPGRKRCTKKPPRGWPYKKPVKDRVTAWPNMLYIVRFGPPSPPNSRVSTQVPLTVLFLVATHGPKTRTTC